jgi:hypothetical protein
MSSREELVERMLEPLYINVPGPELDKLRLSIGKVFSVLEKAPEKDIRDHIYFGAFSENYDIVFALPQTEIGPTLNLEANRLTSNAMLEKASGMSELVSAVGDFMCLKHATESRNESRDGVLYDLMAHVMMRLYKEEKQQDLPDDFGGRALVLVHLRHRTIQNERKALLIAFWRRSK